MMNLLLALFSIEYNFSLKIGQIYKLNQKEMKNPANDDPEESAEDKILTLLKIKLQDCIEQLFQ